MDPRVRGPQSLAHTEAGGDLRWAGLGPRGSHLGGFAALTSFLKLDLEGNSGPVGSSLPPAPPTLSSSSWSPQFPSSGSLHLCSSQPGWPPSRLYSQSSPSRPPSLPGTLCSIAQSSLGSVHKISSRPSIVSASNPAWGISVAFIVTSHTCGFSLALFSPRRMCTLGR